MAFTLESPAFAPSAPMPRRFSRDGGNVSPKLEWADPPPHTRSFVLLLEDPDAPAPAFRHWVTYEIPAERRHLPESGSSKAREEDLPHAINSFGNAHYDGPQPPPDHRRTPIGSAWSRSTSPRSAFPRGRQPPKSGMRRTITF